MTSTRSATYIRTVLQPTFEFTNKHFYKYIIEINIAHVKMLRKQQILNSPNTSKLLDSLDKLYRHDVYDKSYDMQYEDLFFMLEAQLEEEVGEELVGNMHIAFSRNDMDATMYRMFWRKEVVKLLQKIISLKEVLLQLVDKHRSTIMPAYTHNQQAQPTTLAHYLLAVNGNLDRDIERCYGLLNRINQSPMGACALGTTGFPIDRYTMAELLGFNGIMENSYDAIGASDYMLEAANVLTTSLATLSRVVYDLLFLATNENNGIRLGDPHVQTSSIMPQKRNPSALEHCRASLSRAIGELKGLTYMSHSVPFGDIVDIGDDIQPTLQRGFEESFNIYDLLTEILSQLTVNKALLYKRSASGFSTVTELADILVRNHGLPFRKAHHVVSSFVKHLTSRNQTLVEGSAELVNQVAHQSNIKLNLTEEEYLLSIDPVQFVSVRSVIGGPSEGETLRQHKTATKKVEKDKEQIKHWNELLRVYPTKLVNTGQ